MAKGLYYYKLVSPYEEDVTKNCKLTVNEIDSNFLNLKDVDIKSAEVDAVTNSVILTRNNGDTLVADLTPILSGSVYDLEVVYENPESGSCSGATIYITYSTMTDDDEKKTVTVPITGLITTNNLDTILGGGILTRVITDSTLTGKGTIGSPLGLSETEKVRPAIRLIDKTKGEELPETYTRGDRYITKEYVSAFGYLYNYDAVKLIQAKLDEEGKGWRVPTKEDWDCLLNSIEPCNFRNHSTAACHQVLGKYAGKKLKATCAWKGSEDCECLNTVPIPGQHCEDDVFEQPMDDVINGNDEFGDDTVFDIEDSEPKPKPLGNCEGVDEFNMRILPTGWGDEHGNVFYENEETIFWTTTHVYNDKSQDLYTKKFKWDVCGVIQEALCPGDRNSIRLVKDFTGDNHFASEVIDGENYNTVLFPDCKAVWTASNFASDNPKYHPTKSIFTESIYKKVVYYINVWNGTEWEKRALTEGETVVIMEGNEHCQYNIEYRVYMADDCNQTLINVDDTVVQRVLDRVIPLIEEEASARTEADAVLSGAIDTEREERISGDTQLWEALIQEAQARENTDNELWDAINQEAQAREETDQELWDAIEKEASARTDVDNQLWDAIAQEASARTDVDNQLWDAIAQEASARTDVDNQLWDAIAEEARIREEIDNQQWAAIEEEARIREQIDNEQWDAINAEIARAIAREDEIDGQLVDVTKNPYILSVRPTDEYNLVLESKDGNEDHFIKIKLDSNFGTF